MTRSRKSSRAGKRRILRFWDVVWENEWRVDLLVFHPDTFDPGKGTWSVTERELVKVDLGHDMGTLALRVDARITSYWFDIVTREWGRRRM